MSKLWGSALLAVLIGIKADASTIQLFSLSAASSATTTSDLFNSQALSLLALGFSKLRMGKQAGTDDITFASQDLPRTESTALVKVSKETPIERAFQSTPLSTRVSPPRNILALFDRLKSRLGMQLHSLHWSELPGVTEFVLFSEIGEVTSRKHPTSLNHPFHKATFFTDDEIGLAVKVSPGFFTLLELDENQRGLLYSEGHNVCHGVDVRALRNGKIVIGHAHLLPDSEDHPGQSGSPFKQYRRVLEYLADPQNGYTNVQIALSIDDRLMGLPWKGDLHQSLQHLESEAQKLEIFVEELSDLRGHSRTAGWIGDTITAPHYRASRLHRNYFFIESIGDIWTMYLANRKIQHQAQPTIEPLFLIWPWTFIPTPSPLNTVPPDTLAPSLDDAPRPAHLRKLFYLRSRQLRASA
jgi:hypothetical protein